MNVFLKKQIKFFECFNRLPNKSNRDNIESENGDTQKGKKPIDLRDAVIFLFSPSFLLPSFRAIRCIAAQQSEFFLQPLQSELFADFRRKMSILGKERPISVR
ncbi:MAG: hypothetical protein ACRC10_07980 [Thermoguttaceae bacterium]